MGGEEPAELDPELLPVPCPFKLEPGKPDEPETELNEPDDEPDAKLDELDRDPDELLFWLELEDCLVASAVGEGAGFWAEEG